jgi:RHS repeat-associated protein
MKYNDTLVANPDSSHLCSFIKTTTALDSGRTVSSWTYFDGRGATVRQFGALTSQGHVGVTDIDYDEMGRVKRTSNPYYASGATAPINPSGKWTTVTYDKLGRAIEIELPDLTKIQSSYNGTTTTVTNQALRQRRQLTDALGRVIRVDEPDANGNLDSGGVPVQPTNYEYDSLDNLTKVTQTQGSITQERLFKYDSLSRLTHERQVEAVATLNDAGVKVGSGGLWTGVYVYDSATGLLKEGYDARGVKTTFIYDNLYRVSQVSFTGETNNVTPNVTYYYDQASSGYFNNGRLTKVETASTSSAPTTSQVFDYDKMGRVAKQQQTIGANGTIAAQTYTLEYGYNLAGQLISEKYPSGRRVAYTVDEAGRLSNVFGGGRTYLSNLSYAGHGGLLAMTYGNGATESFSYNDRLQLTQQSLVKNSSVIQQYEYGYGVVNLNDGTVDTSKNTGQLARVDGFIGGSVSSPTKQWQQRFSYDSIGRLERAKEVRGDNSQLVWESKFSYDRFGNRYRKVSENPNSLPFVAVEESDVDKATNRISTNTTYDEAGNTTTDSKFRNRQYRYDANGRMVWTQPTSSGTESKAVYDALGQRVATQVNGNWRYVVYDIGGKMVAEYGQSSTATDKIRYMMLDRQGSTRAILNQSATVLARFDYQPFGEDIGAGVGMRTSTQGYGSTDSSRQRYALTERDEATGLDHTWWRKYENAAGRWTSPDPFKGSMTIDDPQSFNRYAYVGNDPINFIDPSGLWLWVINPFVWFPIYWTPNPNGGINTNFNIKVNVSINFGRSGSLGGALGAAGFGRASKRAITEGESRGGDKGGWFKDTAKDFFKAALKEPSEREKFIQKCIQDRINKRVNELNKERDLEIDTNMLWSMSPENLGVVNAGIVRDFLPETTKKNKNVAAGAAFTGILISPAKAGAGVLLQGIREGTKGRIDFVAKLAIAKEVTQDDKDVCELEAIKRGL